METSATNGHYNFSKADLPLRVIHVGDTLGLANELHGGICLIKPTNWDFHVLSHTWSQDIRDLSSKDIGELLKKKRSSSTDELDAYNQAFLKANFGKKQAYKDLAQLLRLLREERVESIWFDALCIDQTNDAEKQKEISHMAAYYANSKGCYVLMHGVGKGYSLWRPDSPKEIPRWFERVWTLQEFILPRSLTFMVEGLDHRVVSVVNRLIAKGSPSIAGLCCCCIPSDLLEKRPSSISAMCQQSTAVDLAICPYNVDIRQCRNNRDVCCSVCHSKVLLRSTSKPGAPLELLHFVDREAFLLVARAALLMDTHGRWIKNWGYEQMLCSMFKLIERKPNPRQIMSRVGERYCSVPEDRVLSILGVLGVQEGGGGGAEQLRAGQTLDDQILKVVNLCDQDTIIELCATDAAGYCIQGMSWSPNFRDNWDRYIQGWMSAERASISLDRSWTSDIHWIRRKVEVLRPITASGMRLRCRMAEAHITPQSVACMLLHVGDSFTRLLTMSKWQHCLHSDDNRNPSPQVVSRVQQKNFKGINMKDFAPWRTMYHGFSTQIFLTVASELIPEDANEQVLGEFKVWLVQLGSVDVQESRSSESESGVELIMVCLGSSDHAAREAGGRELELHKVGMLALKSEEASQIYDTQESSECVLGGFGQDLSKYLNIITATSTASSTHLIQASGAAGRSSASPNQIVTSMPLMVHIPLSPIFEWTTTFVKISYPDAAHGEAVAYSGSDPIIFPYGRTIDLDLEAPHIKQLLHRYLMDRGSLPSGCPVGFILNGMSTIQFFFSSNRKDGVSHSLLGGISNLQED